MAEKTAEPRSAQAAYDVPEADIAASQLSALVDGELAEAEINLVLRRLSRDHEVQGRWERYHLISDTLQGHLPAALDPGFALCIREAIDREPAFQSTARPVPAWFKPAAGFALAASVVLATLFGLHLTRPDTAPVSSPSVAAVAPAPLASLPLQTLSLNPSSANVAGGPAEIRLNTYLVNHNGHASRNSVNGMLPYVRMVGYQGNR